MNSFLIQNIIIFLFLFLFLFLLIIIKNNYKFSCKFISYSGTCICIATITSLFPVFQMPQGGSVCLCSNFFITLIGYWFGLKSGVLSGISYGFINLIISWHVYHPMQILLDYIIGFGILGISGLFQKKRYGLYIGYIISMLLRLLITIISGLIFFREYSFNNPLIYSIIYNMSYTIPEMIITIVLISIPSVKKVITHINPNHIPK